VGSLVHRVINSVTNFLPQDLVQREQLPASGLKIRNRICESKHLAANERLFVIITQFIA